MNIEKAQWIIWSAGQAKNDFSEGMKTLYSEQEQAEEIAEHLSVKYKGTAFFVCQLKTSFMVDKPSVTNYE